MTERQTTFREAILADAEFIYRVVEATMRTYVEQTWGSFSEEYNRKNIAETIAAGNYSIIQFEGEDIGALSIERHPSHIQLAQFYILPAHQNRGIGTSILRKLVSEGRQARKPIRLRIIAVNPVRRLYEREGFRVTSTTLERIYLEFSPP
jgi:GNAT superfamily N-acetyltransferase